MPAFFNPIALVAILAASASAASVTSTYNLFGNTCFPKNAPGPKNCRQTSNAKWGGYCICSTVINEPTPVVSADSSVPIITPAPTPTPEPYVPQCNVLGLFYPSANAPVFDLLYRVSLDTCMQKCKGADRCQAILYDGVTGTDRCWLMTGNVEEVNYYPGPGGYNFYDKACVIG